jgi:hypothetical protein
MYRHQYVSTSVNIALSMYRHIYTYGDTCIYSVYMFMRFWPTLHTHLARRASACCAQAISPWQLWWCALGAARCDWSGGRLGGGVPERVGCHCFCLQSCVQVGKSGAWIGKLCVRASTGGLGVEGMCGLGVTASAYNCVLGWARVLHELGNCACEHQLVAWEWSGCVGWVSPLLHIIVCSGGWGCVQVGESVFRWERVC